MAELNPTLFFIIVVTIALIFAFIPFIKGSISNAQNAYECVNPPYTIQSANLLLCTNASYACLNPALPVLAAPLCTNESGVHVVNESATSGYSVYNESAAYYGPTPVEMTLSGIIVLAFVIGGIYFIIKRIGIGG